MGYIRKYIHEKENVSNTVKECINDVVSAIAPLETVDLPVICFTLQTIEKSLHETMRNYKDLEDIFQELKKNMKVTAIMMPGRGEKQ